VVEFLAVAVTVKMPWPVSVTTASHKDQPEVAFTIVSIADSICVAVESLVSDAVVAVSEGEVLAAVKVNDPPVASEGMVRMPDENVAVPADIDVQLVPEAAGVPPGVPIAAVMLEAGKAIDSMGYAAEFTERTR
jgi:hypothetical protein